MSHVVTTASVLSDVADLVSAIIWPLLIVGLVWFFREPVADLARRIGSSAQRVSIGAQGFSVDLASNVEPVREQGATGLASVRRPEPAGLVVDSAAITIFQQVAQEEPAPYLVVDLGEGRDWLTSRLYIFSILLRSMRQTRTLIFVETAGDIRGRFVGLAAPEAVRYALARAYPWLEAEYANAYAGATAQYRGPGPPLPGQQPFIVDASGRLRPEAAHAIATSFVFGVQQDAPAVATPGSPGWVIEQHGGGVFAEHASWLTAADLERLLGDTLRRFAYVVDLQAQSAAERVNEVLAIAGEDVVALVNEQHRFRDAVVNRRDILEALGGEARRDDSGEE